MHYAPQILLCCTAWITVFTSCLAKEPIDPELLKQVTKDVETVLSPTLVEKLQGAQSNHSAMNVGQTAPRNPEQPGNIHDKKSDIQFDNHVYPYHYERSYHYQYPPNPHSDPLRPVGYTESFYDPRFRPKGYPIDGHDPSYYRSELYNPFGNPLSQNVNSNLNPTPKTDSNTNSDTAVNGDAKQPENSGSTEASSGPTPLPPSSFPQSDILAAPPQPNPFPSPDLGGYRPGGFGRPLLDRNYFRPSGEVGQNQKDLPGHYLPHGDGRFAESLHQRPVGPYPPLPPLDSFQNYPTKDFQGFNEHRPSLPDSSAAHRSQHLSPPFLGPFFSPGYQSPFYNGYRPSEHFNSIFNENFTRSFPLRPSFGGFYPSNNYLPPPPSSPPSPTAAPAESKPEEPASPEGPSAQPIPTTKPDETAPVPAASNSQYQLKLFFPAKDDVKHISQPRSSEELTYITRSFRF